MSDIFPVSWSRPTEEEVVAPCCPRCGDSLVLHQPDPQLPHRLLAVCEACKTWYVSDPRGLLLSPVAGEPGRPSRARKDARGPR